MRWWFRRPRSRSPRPPPPARTVNAGLPRLDGSGWPDAVALGRPSFEAQTFHELGLRHAYDPDVHALAERLVAAALPRLPTGVSREDEPHLRKVFLSAARTGAGIGRVERSQAAAPPGEVDRRIAGALWQARRGLPSMPDEWAVLGGWFVLAGRHLAVRGGGVDELLEELGVR